MNFHIGFLASADDLKGAVDQSKKIDFTKESSLMLLGNAQNVAEVILTGVCHRYPDLKFVSVENGAGWLPFLGEAMDWQWLNVGAHKDYPDRLLPSDYLRRQIYGMYWFEQASVRSVIDQLADNLMFETDFPHATSLSPGPASESPSPREVIERSLAGLPESHRRQGPPTHRHRPLPPRPTHPLKPLVLGTWNTSPKRESETQKSGGRQCHRACG